MSVEVKKKPVTTHNNVHFKIKKQKKRKRYSSASEKPPSFFPGGDRTDPLNLKDPDVLVSYSPSPDHSNLIDLPTPIVVVDKTDPLCLKRSPKRKRERRSSRYKPPEETKPAVKFNEKAKKFCYGNYSKYYGYRNPDQQDDVRLQFLDKSLFKDKDCLDLGCNIGHITLTIAKEYEPKKIVGVDIDGNLINVARKNIRRYLSKEKSSEFPMSMQVCYGPLFGHDSGDKSFPHNVAFRQENWVPQQEPFTVTEKFDVIICLSVTKWVHLNWGDKGIKNLFTKMYRSLRPGGKLLLECQPWKTYARRKKLTAQILENYSNIQIYPHEFPQYLSTMGFTDFITVGVPHHTQKGFRRPLWLFTKPLTVTTASAPGSGINTPITASAPDSGINTPILGTPHLREPKTPDTPTTLSRVLNSISNSQEDRKELLGSPKSSKSSKSPGARSKISSKSPGQSLAISVAKASTKNAVKESKSSKLAKEDNSKKEETVKPSDHEEGPVLKKRKFKKYLTE